MPKLILLATIIFEYGPLNSLKYIYCKPGFYFTAFPFFLQERMPGIMHEALPILVHLMNKIQYT